MSDPVGELRSGGAGVLLARNDDWRSTQEAEIAATGIMPGDDREPAIVGTYAAGGYAFYVTPKGRASGPALGELYDRSIASSPSAFRALFAKARALTGEDVLIFYFIVSGTTPKRVLIRALGAELATRGYSGALVDPTLQLVSSEQVVVASNDNWNSPANPAIAATGLAPTDARSAALLVTLAPGGYTTIVRGAGTSTGLVFADVIDLDAASPYPDPLAELPPPPSRLPTFPAWQAAIFDPAERADSAISGAAADGEGDGLGNLLEYAFGTDPRLVDGASVAPVAGQAGGYATISFSRLPSRTDLSYRVEATDRLAQGSWTEIARSDAGSATAASPGQSPSTISETPAGDAVSVTVGDTVPAGPSAPHRFLRLRAVRP